MIIRKEGRYMDERELPGPDPMPENSAPMPEDTDGGLPEPGLAPAPGSADPGSEPDSRFAPDPEWDAYLAWREREIAAGRDEKPPAPWKIEGPAVSLSLGDATDIDPALLAAICGPDGLGGDALGPQFGQDAPADVLRPGPVLAAMTEQACDDLSRLTDNQLIGALQAARRLENHAHYLQTTTIAEFARRRAEEFETAKARGVRVRCRAGEFPGVELASELLISGLEAARWIDSATGLTTRLPKTLQSMSAGLIDAERGGIIAAYTGSLSDEDAAKADEILATAAPNVRAETLARRAATLEMKLDPEAARTRKEKTKRAAQRVQVQLERSGNASVAGRELDVADAMASKANIHGIALRLRRAGIVGSLDHLRVTVFNDLLQGRNPFDRLAPVPEAPATDQDIHGDQDGRLDDHPLAEPPTPNAPTPEADQAPSDDVVPPGDLGMPDAPIPEGPTDEWGSLDDPIADEWGDADGDGVSSIGVWPRSGGDLSDDEDADNDDESYEDEGATAAGSGGAARTPAPAVINLLVHAGTLFGWDTTPSQASGWGLLNPVETRDVVRAASLHPQTRWCMTIIGPDGTAVAHGCSPGQHPWSPVVPPNPEASAPPGLENQENSASSRTDRRQAGPAPRGQSPPRPDEPDPRQAEQFFNLVRALNLTFEPIAKGTCEHGHGEERYTPGRKLQHLVRARSTTCTAPGCQAQAVYADLDHTTPYPEGPTDECNLGPLCRTHHRAKQTPGWKVEQPEPGVFRWTLPSGRTHTTRPATY